MTFYVAVLVMFFTSFEQTFMTLALVDVTSRIGLTGIDEAEKYIRDMVRFSKGLWHIVMHTWFCRLRMGRSMLALTSWQGWCPSKRTQRIMTAYSQPCTWTPSYLLAWHWRESLVP